MNSTTNRKLLALRRKMWLCGENYYSFSYFLFQFWVLYICLITSPNKLDILASDDCVVIFTLDTVLELEKPLSIIMAYFLTERIFSSTPNRVLNGTYWVIAQWSEQWQLKPGGLGLINSQWLQALHCPLIHFIPLICIYLCYDNHHTPSMVVTPALVEVEYDWS